MLAFSFEVIEKEIGKNSDNLVYQSKTTIIESKLWQGGSLLMKFIENDNQGEVACYKRCKRTWDFLHEGLVQTQIAQPCKNILTWGRIPFHEKSQVIKSISLVRPMWPARGWLCSRFDNLHLSFIRRYTKLSVRSQPVWQGTTDKLS